MLQRTRRTLVRSGSAARWPAHRWPAHLVTLLLACQSRCQQLVAWEQCGGTSSCQEGGLAFRSCANAPWTGVLCPPTYCCVPVSPPWVRIACVLHDMTLHHYSLQFWQCRNDQLSSCPSSPSPTVSFFPTVTPSPVGPPTQPVPPPPPVLTLPPQSNSPIIVAPWAQYDAHMKITCTWPTAHQNPGVEVSTLLTRDPAGLQ